MRASARAQREQRDARILAALASGATVRQAAEAHGVSKSTAHRVLENAKGTLPEAKYARDLMLVRFQQYRLRLAPYLASEPLRAVPKLLEVDLAEAKMRGILEPQRSDGTAEVAGMLAMLIGRDRDEQA